MAHRIVYASRRYISGLTNVLLNLYDPDNSQVVTNGTMTELGSTGTYYYDYTPTQTGTFTGTADSATQPRKELISFEITSLTAAAGSGGVGGDYCTTLQVLQFLDLEKEIPAFVEGISSSEENVGTGDNSITTFYLNNNNIIAGTYTLSSGSSEAAASDLTETTHYVIDKDAGKITLTGSGVTQVGTDDIFAAYKYSSIADSVVSDFVSRASRVIDNITNSAFATNTETLEYHDGKTSFEINYYTRNVPIISVITLETTQNDDETFDSATTWDSLTENDEFYADLKTGRISVTYTSARPIKGIKRLRITYTWGHATVPVAVEEECVRLAAQKLQEGTVIGGVIGANKDLDATKLNFTINDIKANLKSYTYFPIEST